MVIFFINIMAWKERGNRENAHSIASFMRAPHVNIIVGLISEGAVHAHYHANNMMIRFFMSTCLYDCFRRVILHNV